LKWIETVSRYHLLSSWKFARNCTVKGIYIRNILYITVCHSLWQCDKKVS